MSDDTLENGLLAEHDWEILRDAYRHAAEHLRATHEPYQTLTRDEVATRLQLWASVIHTGIDNGLHPDTPRTTLDARDETP